EATALGERPVEVGAGLGGRRRRLGELLRLLARPDGAPQRLGVALPGRERRLVRLVLPGLLDQARVLAAARDALERLPRRVAPPPGLRHAELLLVLDDEV